MSWEKLLRQKNTKRLQGKSMSHKEYMMVQLYYILVTEGRRDIEEVPERYRAEVQSMLDLFDSTFI
jgi:hypothetical protein